MSSDPDWAAKGRQMTEDGSDGLWLRFGPKPSDSTLSKFFSCRCNPCVTIFATVLLFGWVLFCMAWTPGKYCQGIQSTEFNQTASCDSPFVPQYDTDVITAGPIHVNAGTDVNGTNGTEANGANDTDGMNGTGANGTNSTNGNDVNGVIGTDVNGRNGTNSTDVNGTTSADKCIFTIKRQKVDDVDCYPPRLEFSYWMAWCTYTWTWLYISTQNIWIVFVFVLIFHPRYGKLKLGADDDQPEFTNMEWFAMIFCCGVATGLFYFSIGEPINHYEPCGKWAFGGPDGADWGTRQCLGTSNWANRFSHLPDNERAQKAMELTFYHWGLHGWVCYAIVGCILGILHFRKGLPMTMKTCFYPLLGERIYGFMGDLIDVLSIVCTTFGVCTSLGMGVQQINAGIKMLSGGTNWLGVKWYGVENQDEWYNDYKDSAKDIWDIQKESWRLSNPWSVATAGLVSQRMTEVSEQILLIWFITTASTVSICTGLDIGVKWLSIIALVLGFFLLWVVLALDDTWFIFNLFVQTLGYYMQNIIETGFYTGAFDQQIDGAPDGRQEYGPPSGAGWMNDWTIFYWGWWISWAPFVGVFLARISKGRTVREFLVTCIIITVLYNFVWMTVWGGAALKMEMAAEHAGIDCSGSYSTNYCRVDPRSGSGAGRFSGEPEYFCSTVTRLSCHYFDYPPMMFDVVNQYVTLGTFLSVLIVIALFLYFITSSDSGSLVDTIVAANGIREPCIAQRVWWSLTEGLAATGLTYSSLFDVADPRAGMKALQAASIASGLPYTFLVCFICVALWKVFKYEFEEDTFESGFRSGVLDFGLTLYTGKSGSDLPIGFGGPQIKADRIMGALKNCFFPFPDLLNCLKSVREKKGEPATMYDTITAVFTGIVLYYTGWLLVFIDWIPVPTGGYITQGVWNGTYNIIDKEISNRYGYFHLYTNEWKAGEVLTTNSDFEPSRGESMGVGDRVGHPMHLLVFGWFFIFMFIGLVMTLRSSAREVLKIKGNPIEDFLCSFFLWPTVLLQIKETLEDGPVGKKEETSL